MVVIRLTRGGSKKDPFYHVVASDKRAPRDGRFIERLGYYHPAARGQSIGLELKTDRIEYWVNQGGQISDRVAYLLKSYKKFGGLAPDKPKKPTKKAVETPPADTSDKVPAVETPPADTSDKVPAVKATPADTSDKAPAVKATPADTSDKAPAVKATPADTSDKAPAVKATPADTSDKAPAAKDNAQAKED